MTEAPLSQTPTHPLAPCPCGSGLRYARCCGLDLGTLAGADSVRHLAPLIERAAQAQHHGAAETAETLCLEVLDLAPGETRALAILYGLRKAAGQMRAAEALAARIVAINPNDFWATNEIALILLGRGALAEAERHARNAVRIAPENPQAHNLMGMILTEAYRPQVGEYHYRKVLDLTGRRDAILLANLAWNLKNQGRMDEARALYEESVAAAPEILQTLLGWARLEEADRRFDAAMAALDRAERAAPDNPSVRLSRALVLGRMGEPEKALALLDDVARATPDGALGPEELLAKGRLLDRLGEYDAAFAAFAEGKAKSRALSGHAYLDNHARDLAARLAGFFTVGRLKLLPRAGLRADSPQPVFIVGFPRSGTTLVEQTLTAHPAISAGDELPAINEIAGLMPRMLESPLAYPEALVELWMGDHRDDLDLLRDHYLRRARQLGAITDGASWFTDKMPLNETHLGLIALLFAESPILHVLRHPLDIVLSAFSNQMTHGFFCAFDLESAARHYALIAELVDHYRKEMALRYLPVRYEDLIGDHETGVRRMLGAIGVGFDPACLAPHENRRYARTASYAQVAEPIYDRSVFRYRKYLKHLEPVLPILRPAIEKLGYSVA
ncbi:MAG: sulfotransferase [Rhodospirillales bacterium]|nr:sulfotransferase [Rhodospirillales bacterium]